MWKGLGSEEGPGAPGSFGRWHSGKTASDQSLNWIERVF